MDLFLAFIFAIGSVICHQLPERSFFLDGRQLPVCARCTGLYLSGAAGLVGWWAAKFLRGWRPQPVPPRPAVTLLLAVATPTVASYLSGVLGVWDGSNITRALLAVPLGVAAGAMVAAVSTKDLR
jgi:uncharacterized membrane protein